MGRWLEETIVRRRGISGRRSTRRWAWRARLGVNAQAAINSSSVSVCGQRSSDEFSDRFGDLKVQRNGRRAIQRNVRM